MTDKQIIIDGVDGLSCTNCSEAKRCQEQQVKKEYAINQVLQDIPSEYANVIARLKQIIPSITRCDYVLEKQLKAKEQECQDLRNLISTFGATGICEVCTDKSVLISDEYTKAIKQIKEIAQWAVKSPMSSATEITKFEGILKTIELAEKRINEAKNNSKYFKLKQTLAEIKEIAENNKHSFICFTAFESDTIEVNNEPMATILQKISECEVDK